MSLHVSFGEYYNIESLIHRIDPRTKFLAVILLMASAIMASTLVTNLMVAGFLLCIILLSRVPLSTVLRSIRPLMPIILATALFNLLFVKTGNVVLDLNIFTITSGATHAAVIFGLRFTYLALAGSLLTLTTNTIELTDGTERLLSPFKRIGLPAHELSMMMSIALRFIPMLADEFSDIMNAQAGRGGRINEGSPVKRLRSLVPLILPLFSSSLRHAENLAEAMVSRGYTGGEGRTHLHTLKFEGIDLAASVVLILFLASVIVLT